MINFKEASKSISSQDYLILLEDIKGCNYKSTCKHDYNYNQSFLAELLGYKSNISTSYETTPDYAGYKDLIEDKLEVGETIYYRVVDTQDLNTYSNLNSEHRLGKKIYQKFVKEFGDTTTFSYGGVESKRAYVYKITLTNIDGYEVNLSWGQVEDRCKKLGVDTFPVIWRGTKFDGGLIQAGIELSKEQKEEGFSPDNYFTKFVKSRCLGKSFLGDHISSGIVIRNETNLNVETSYEESFLSKNLI